jgi:uncharacterized protein
VIALHDAIALRSLDERDVAGDRPFERGDRGAVLERRSHVRAREAAREELADEGVPRADRIDRLSLVDQITKQLGLSHHASIRSSEFPPVVTFEDGLVQDPVRVYAGEEPPVMTLRSDLALPLSALEPVSKCVLSEMATEYHRTIFIAGAPAASEEQIGNVMGAATTEALREELRDADVPIAEEHGVVGGITGALVRECYQLDIPATLLSVRAHPHLPDPGAAKAVIETALEPLVEFEIVTTELEEHAEEIRNQMNQIAQ